VADRRAFPDNASRCVACRHPAPYHVMRWLSYCGHAMEVQLAASQNENRVPVVICKQSASKQESCSSKKRPSATQTGAVQRTAPNAGQEHVRRRTHTAKAQVRKCHACPVLPSVKLSRFSWRRGASVLHWQCSANSYRDEKAWSPLRTISDLRERQVVCLGSSAEGQNDGWSGYLLRCFKAMR